MPLSSKRSQRKRRELTHDISNTPTEEEVTPTRPSKRRKKLSEPELSEPETPSKGDDDLITQVTQQLKSHPVQASKDHANTIHEANGDGVKAYAKVAAHDWTFYITKLIVNIGRAPEGPAPDSSSTGRHGRDSSHDDGAGDRGEEEKDHVHVDLGPSKTVSREHAIISFESKSEKWLLTVKGRNGVKVDSRLLKAGGTHELSSGEVLEIGNVEMMFVLPSEISPLHIHPSILEKCGLPSTTPMTRATSRQTPHLAPIPSINQPPGTPPPSTQSRHAVPMAKSPAFSTPGPVMVGANGADLSQDENKHIKPQYSYAQMITQAIISVPEAKMTLNGIYNYIMTQYAYYRFQAPSGWQNSIRHNLSLSKHFEKVARSTYEPGKGAKWQIVSETRDELVHNAWRIGRGGHRGSSAPSSPSQLNYITQGPREMAARGSPSSRKRRSSILGSPPPRSSLPMSQSTPDGALKHARSNATLTADGSPLPRSKKSALADPSFSNYNSYSPTLTSSFLQDDGGSFVTPAPPRVHPRLAPPSTAQRPSQHMPTSSPAPFWRFIDIGSTPLRGTSPTKMNPAPPPESSSPIRGNKSPPSSPTRPHKEIRREDLQSKETIVADAPPLDKDEEDDDDDEQGFDLAQGFQSIGSFHQHSSRDIVTNTTGPA